MHEGENQQDQEQIRPGRLVEAAVDVAEHLLREANADLVGALSWGGGYGTKFQPVPDAGMFNGRIGEALFFAVLFQATMEARYADAALHSVHGIIDGLGTESGGLDLVQETGLGLTGMGSIVYALTRMATLLDRKELLAAAERGAQSITPAAIRADRVGDVFSGKAGAVLGLITLADAGYNSPVELAITCGDELLSRRTEDPHSGLRAWATLEPEPWSGFAHGSSGIAAALVRLGHFASEPRYTRAAMEAFAFERTLIRADLGDWPDSRSAQTGGPAQSSWCHGSPGIALSRLCSLDSLTNEEDGAVVDDLDYALTSVCQLPLHPLDNLCCGNLGRADILLEASLRLENTSLAAQARNVALQCLSRAHDRRFHIPVYADAPHLRTGLWQGLAGIGYALLRLADPKSYPCLLSLS
jgi:lantibiotic modifying enzyme